MVAVVGYIPTPEGRAAIEAAVEEARTRGITLLVVNATRGDSLVDPRFASSAAMASLDDFLNQSGVTHELVQLVEGLDPAEQVLHVADARNADLIIIGLRRRSPVGKLIMGSVAQKILLDAMCPVLSVKATDEHQNGWSRR
ncbi:MAG: universal stress protein [Dermatophilaceae bacterium]|nr:universal stress protein [Dermatophilaceae bacterium]MBP9919503.1 universal stress protein [Dermatophilaceae bacterium]